MKIAIFTNGDSNIGFGHISRTLVIADEFRKKSINTVFYIPSTCLFQTKIINKGFELKVLDTFQESYANVNLLKNEYDIILIDSVERDYLDLFWVTVLSRLIVTITLFDFHKLKRYEALSFYPHIGENTQVKINNLCIYSGRDYLTFDPVFSKYRFKTTKKNAKDILVTMGGTDPFGLTLSITEAISCLKRYDFTVLLSEKSPTYNLVKERIGNLSNVTILDFVNDMPKRLSESDIVILNGGLTRYESCIVGTPFIGISIHNKQYNITQELVDLVGGTNIGIYDTIGTEEICNEINKLMRSWVIRNEITSKMQNLIDINGAERICNIIVDFYKKNYEEVN